MRTHQVFPGARITNDRCLWLEHEATIVIADLHIGLESALEADGLHLPRFQTDNMREALIEIIDRYSPQRVVILGDLKHEFSRNVGQELAEVRSILSLLKESSEVNVARGNHDNYLPNIAFKLGINVEERFIIGGITLMHGHTPTDSRPLVIGHEHPSVKVFDEVRANVRLPCFLHLEKERIVVLPAFSPLAPGTDYTSGYGGRTISPVLAHLDIGRAKVYGCSDIGLLPLGELRALSGLREISDR